MPLSVGDKLGPYEVLSLLGQGGMGEVYRAKDTKLDRDVAIKVLPQVLARDPERLARFEREAKVLASLDHPNIGHIHGIVDSEDSRGLVLALIDGPTLADRIEAGPIPLDEAIAISKQIIEALEYAHDRGVVHRDLKPANVKITPEGVVKVLDFGLAKVLEDEPPASSLTNSPTLTVGHTRAGMILGTAAYMSPEQAVGRPVDRRSDIFSFGAVLYEMLTGQRAFAGSATPDVLEAVVKNDPDWSALPADTPSAVRQLLRRCLAKDRKQRLQAIGEARITLENPTAPGPGSSGPQTGETQRLGKLWPGIAALFAIAAMALAVLYFRQTPPVERTLRYTIPAPEKSVVLSLAISPDGRNVVIHAETNGKRQLWLRAMDAAEAKAMPGTDGAVAPFWSPDSRFIAFFAEGKLKKIAASGGPAEPICDANAAGGGSWSKDDVILFARISVESPALQRVSANGGVPVDVLKGVHYFPAFLPDGRHFLYLDRAGEKSGIYAASLDGKETHRILASSSGAVFEPASGSDTSSHLLFLREGTLMAQSFDTGSTQLSDDAVPIAQGISTINFVYTPVTVSANGMLVYYTAGDSNQLTQITWVDRTGKPLGTMDPPGHSSAPAISPDERTVAFQRPSPNGADIWLHDLASGRDTRLTAFPSLNSTPVWSGKGDRIAFHSLRTGTLKLYQRAANGSGQDEVLPSVAGTMMMNQWSKDGQFIVFVEAGEKGDYDIGVLSMKEGAPADRKPTVFLHSQFNEYHGQLSPDSHWMAYSSDESGQREVYVVPFPAGEGKTLVSTAGGEQPRWRGDGKELFYRGANGKMMAVPVRAGAGAAPSFEAGAPVPLFDANLYRIIAAPMLYQYDVTADGKRFVIATSAEAASQPLNVVTNWQSLLKK